METVIETKGLSKRYGTKVAVDNLDLTIQRGEVFGLLGPNGSGKTTTILMLLGLTEPTSGRVRVLGYDPTREPLKVKARVGYLPDQVGFYDELTARENLRYIARLNRIPYKEMERRIEAALQRMGLSEEALRRPVRTFSHGMRQRLGLAELLVKRAEIIILDEPTLGLDPEAAREFLKLIRGLKDEGVTVLLSSHLLHQVQAICDRVGLFHQGRMVLEGTVPDLAQRVLGGAYNIRLEASGPNISKCFDELAGVVRVQASNSHNGVYRYLVEAQHDVRGEAARAVVANGGTLLSLDLEQPSLDEVYAHYFKEVAHAA
ncbi:MAG: ABC transporter ATP-binding protein [Anaerolineales bacterium]|nr:ABC transporter ATP-binding protein [Anaerolineales bacterium]